MWKALLTVCALAAIVATAATAGRDPLTGMWIAEDIAGDGSTDRYIFSAANHDGIRSFTLVDSDGTFCETEGEGTGAPMTASGTAILSGTTVTTTIESFVCGNGNRGVFDPHLVGTAEITSQGLDNGYYIAVRVGR